MTRETGARRRNSSIGAFLRSSAALLEEPRTAPLDCRRAGRFTPSLKPWRPSVDETDNYISAAAL